MATDIMEVAFKAGRIGIYANSLDTAIKSEDYVIVEAEKGFDLGKALQQGHVYYEEALGEDLKHVAKLAKPKDIVRLQENRNQEEKAIRICKEKIMRHQLNMNLVDAEFQWDHNKLTFYFTSEQRVDFRELVKDLAGRFRTRIELRQIGVRDAARHTGGYGACGCQLCCTTFIKKFENITTQYVREQLITTNPSKLTGICGRLKCCLAYEKDFYMEELSRYPQVGAEINTPEGKGVVKKIDIFNRVIYVQMQNQDIEKFYAEEILNSSPEYVPELDEVSL